LAEHHKRSYGTPLPGVDLSALKGKLIVVEGADGSGRTTQIEFLRDWLHDNGYPTVEVGIKRSALAGRELAMAMRGHTLSPITFSLFYATDFADTLQHQIVPALRADFIVLADRYIYTLMARDMARGVDYEWVRDMYSYAIVPDAIFYFKVPPSVLAERTLRRSAVLDYWESGMDIGRAGTWYQSFIRYQKTIRKIFHELHGSYAFQVIDASRKPFDVADEMRDKVTRLLEGKSLRAKKWPHGHKKIAKPPRQSKAAPGKRRRA
jgi:dTMP kinase